MIPKVVEFPCLRMDVYQKGGQFQMPADADAGCMKTHVGEEVMIHSLWLTWFFGYGSEGLGSWALDYGCMWGWKSGVSQDHKGGWRHRSFLR